MKAAIGDTDAHTSFLANFFGTVSREATDTLRPKYGQLYGFEYAQINEAAADAESGATVKPILRIP